MFGIEYWALLDLSSPLFVPVHRDPIQDLAPSPLDHQIVATVSLDRRVVITSLRSRSATLECTLPVPLWSCAWIEHSTVAVGGANGRFFIVNGMGTIVVDTVLSPGPPVFSICRLSPQLLYVASPVKAQLFNVASGAFTGLESRGAHVVRIFGDSVVQISKAAGSASLQIGRLGKSKDTIEMDRSIPIRRYDRLARPSIVQTGGVVYLAIPDEENLTFCLKRLDNLDRDYWDEWSRLFLEPKHPSPVLDLAIHTGVEFMLASVSPELLRVYEFPIPVEQ
jgi:WD40 repeat protein